MFTGLIQEIGDVTGVRETSTGRQITIDAPATTAETDIGASIACSGICLTVERLSGTAFEVHAGSETLQRSTAGDWTPGTQINLEPALRVSDRLGGHIVQGHVDCVGRCEAIRPVGETIEYTFSLPEEFRPYIAEKGSIAINGISLTVAAIDGEEITVAIIPHTMDNTTLAQMEPQQRVNVEVDILAKYVRRMMNVQEQQEDGGLTEEFLREHGFMK
ncbi:MAG: riboflavin synthase [Armatimonadota bacterium]